MTYQNDLALKILEQTENDIILWEYDKQAGYIGNGHNLKFRVYCNRKDHQIAIDDFWFTTSREMVDRICQAIARQSERMRTNYYLDRLNQFKLATDSSQSVKLADNPEEKGGAA